MTPYRLNFHFNRHLWISLLTASFAAFGADKSNSPTPAFPLWDGHESVADYAKRVNLPPTQTLDLGGGVKMDFVLIPAGKFIMGTPEPTPVDEALYQNQIIVGQTLLAASAGVLLVLIVFVFVRAIRENCRPQLSLGRLLLVTVAAGECVLCGMHWRQSELALKIAHANYAEAIANFKRYTISDEKPSHCVTLTQPVYMGKFTVTQKQFLVISGRNPSHFYGLDNPVESVSWNDSQAFCQKVSEQTKLTIRLPTEAEWEFACRAGTTTTFYSGNSESDLARIGWYKANSKGTTHPVGQKESNQFGIYDANGNVWQWCQDWYADDYYADAVSENPKGPSKGFFRAARGGSWEDYPTSCRSAVRLWIPPKTNSLSGLGFRVVLEPSFNSSKAGP